MFSPPLVFVLSRAVVFDKPHQAPIYACAISGLTIGRVRRRRGELCRGRATKDSTSTRARDGVYIFIFLGLDATKDTDGSDPTALTDRKLSRLPSGY